MTRHPSARLLLGAGMLVLISYFAYAEGGMAVEPTVSLWEKAAPGQIVELTGKIRRVGNEPFTAVILTDESGKDWYLDEDGTALLKAYEQKTVSVRAKVNLKELVLANGKKLTPRRILTEIYFTGSASAQPGD